MNLLITGAWNATEKEKAELESLGYKIFFLQNESEVLPVDAEKIDAVVCNSLFLFHPVGEFTRLKLIQLTSAGLDRVPINEIRARGIALFNAAGVYSIPMAEFALCGVLQLYKQSRFFYENQTHKKWEKHRGLLELNGKTVLIVGCGSVGRACAERFRAFGCRILGVDVAIIDSPLFDRVYQIGDLADLLSTADVILLSLPLTKETEGLFDARHFSRMKDGAVFVNLARGRLADQEALLDNLGRLRGAVLDVFEEEPLAPSSPLWNQERIVLTPHVSFIGDGNAARLQQVIYQNLKGFVSE
ncbi:MAG: hydroxyacid dehydrogenase [Clostridia bacterium]|nr:hydroxyacid dehydrogenase [Clostridia bacterium]